MKLYHNKNLITKNYDHIKGFPLLYNLNKPITADSSNSSSFLFCGTILYWHWEAMVTSYLSARTIVLPFKDLPGILKTDFRIAASPGESIHEFNVT